MSALKPAQAMSTPELVELLQTANAAYRAGAPIMPDATYDHAYIAELVGREPSHPFLNSLESEGDFGKGKIRHKTALLSTAKAYTQTEIEAFVSRVQKAAQDLGLDQAELRYRMTPKLDGIAGSFVDGKLATRGSGLLGNDISHIFDAGTVAVGGNNTGAGEVVIDKTYWEANLEDLFAHPRNLIAGLVGADALNDDAKEALESGAVRFVPFSQLNFIEVDAASLVEQLIALCAKLEADAGYETDGVVIEVTHKAIKSHLGSTSHHHKWQIAKKRIGETAVALVEGVNWQVGKSGRITPVIVIEPTPLSGSVITNVAGHHAGNVKNLNIGAGARIEIVRSGSVVPKLLSVASVGSQVEIPKQCPACGARVDWANDFLVCSNSRCDARLGSRLRHFFATIGNVDLFGPKTIETLVSKGVCSLPEIYCMRAEEFVAMGFGPKQSQNLVEQLLRSRTEAVENWRFLAAFGIHHLGRGDSRRLLEVFDIEALERITVSEIEQIENFGPITAPNIASQLRDTWPLIRTMLDFGFNLRADEAPAQTTSVLSGKSIVFTGTLSQPREAMQEAARALGANVQSSVCKTTDILIAGDNVGVKKIEAAQGKGVSILSETEYQTLLTTPARPANTAANTIVQADAVVGVKQIQKTLALDFEL